MLDALLGFIAYVGAMMVGVRVFSRASPAVVAFALAPVVCLVALAATALQSRGINLWTYLVTYWFLVTGFLMGFGAMYKSLSLRILSDLLEKAGHSDDARQIFTRYLVQDSYQNRLAMMCETEMLAQNADHYTLLTKGRRLASRVRTLQLWFGIQRSG